MLRKSFKNAEDLLILCGRDKDQASRCLTDGLYPTRCDVGNPLPASSSPNWSTQSAANRLDHVSDVLGGATVSIDCSGPVHTAIMAMDMTGIIVNP